MPRLSPPRSYNSNNHNSNNHDNSDSQSISSTSSSSSSSDGEITGKFSHLREMVRVHPRVKQAKRSLKLVRKMERITKSERYQQLMKEGHSSSSSSSSSDSEENNDKIGEKSTTNNEKKNKNEQQEDSRKAIDEAKIKNALLMAASLEQLQIDSPNSPGSAFSSDKLCSEFLQASRLAGVIQIATDDIVEIALEEVTPHWSNTDIYPIVRDALEAAEELQRHCRDDLERSAVRFCGAAEKVIRGAREEVRSMSEEILEVQAVNERFVAKIEDVKSKILKERQRAENLLLANSARKLCLLESGTEFSKIFSESTREALMHEVGTQEIFGQDVVPLPDPGTDDIFASNDNNNKNEDDESSSSSLTLKRKGSSFVESIHRPADQYKQSIRSRLRILLSTSLMQVKGQKTADERVLQASSSSMNAGGKYATMSSHQSPVGSSRILQALETILGNL